MYALYSALLAFFLVLTLPYWLLQMMRHGKYRAGLRQRFGAVPAAHAGRGEKPAIWVHAVSVGEVVASSAAVTALWMSLCGMSVLAKDSKTAWPRSAALSHTALQRGDHSYNRIGETVFNGLFS